jgi:hypothetical protein
MPLVEIIDLRDSIMYYFDPNDASALYDFIQSRTGVRHGYPLGPHFLNSAISNVLRNIEERCRHSSAIHNLDDGNYIMIIMPFILYVITIVMKELEKEGMSQRTTDKVVVHCTPIFGSCVGSRCFQYSYHGSLFCDGCLDSAGDPGV